MKRAFKITNVLDAAIDRMIGFYSQGHRIMVSFSAGKDSNVALEICIIAATETNRLPVEVIMRDEEIMYPGTFEYAMRTAQRPEIDFNWIYACQPIINICNRASPYFWTFDPALTPDQWVREPPEIAYKIPHKNIISMNHPDRYPPPSGKKLYSVLGMRVSESMNRMYGLFSMKSCVTKPNVNGVASIWPIYDMKDGDIWKCIHDFKWDYNQSYDTFYKLGVKKSALRIAPPTLNSAGADQLIVSAKAWPKWFEKVCDRLPGVRTYAQFGRRAVQPMRRHKETWEDCFKRTCIDEAPDWIRERATKAMNQFLSAHAHHSGSPLPEIKSCQTCQSNVGSWRSLALGLYNGDPFSMKYTSLSFVEPDYFRKGAGKWEGKPTF